MNIFLAVTGSNGAILAKRAADVLSEEHCVLISATEQGEQQFLDECGVELYDFLRRKQRVVKYSEKHLETVDCMLILPCSPSCIGSLASGCHNSLLTGAADRILAEKKRLVLAIGEPILSPVTLKNLERLSTLGALVCPIVSQFSKHRTVDKMYDVTLSQILHFCGIEAKF